MTRRGTVNYQNMATEQGESACEAFIDDDDFDFEDDTLAISLDLLEVDAGEIEDQMETLVNDVSVLLSK